MDLGRYENCKLHFQKESDSYKKKLFRQMWLRQKVFKKFEMPYLEVMVTTRCNLSCVGCANLIPQCKPQFHVDKNIIFASLDRLLHNVDRIYHFKINGGEALLHPQLYDILMYVGKCNQPKKKFYSLRLTTNGTIIPTEQILNAIKQVGIVVQISDYHLDSAKKLMQVLDEHKIPYRFFRDQTWNDMGGFEKRPRNCRSMCSVSKCVVLLENKIYICPRAAIMDRLDIAQGDCVEVFQSKKMFQKNMIDLYNNQNINACWYCDGDTEFSHKIPAGIQQIREINRGLNG